MEHSTVVEAGAFFLITKKKEKFLENFPNIFAMIPCNSGLWPLTKI
jgi:hypothetical protein